MHFIVDYLCTFSFINSRHVANFRNITLLTHHPGLNPNKNVMNSLLNRVGHVCTPLHHIIRPHLQPDPQTTAIREAKNVPLFHLAKIHVCIGCRSTTAEERKSCVLQLHYYVHSFLSISLWTQQAMDDRESACLQDQPLDIVAVMLSMVIKCKCS